MTKKLSYRFADYTEPWEQRKLGDVGETYTGLSGKTKEDFGHGEGKFITYVNVFNNPLTDLYGLDSVEIDDKQRRVQYGDVLFTTSSETPEDVGLSSVWLGREDNVYLNSFCFGYRPKKDIFDLYYLAFVLRSFSVRREFMLLAQGISRFNISKTKVMDMSINVPSLPEQTAIGSFFQDIDQLISLQQRKLEVLKEQKKTYLKLLFPVKGQTKPALRFAGFEDDWKEVKVSDIFRVTRGQVLATTEISEEKTDTYKYPVYSSQTKNEGLLGYYDKYLFETAITWTTDGANAGTVNYREGKFYSTNVNGVLLSDEGFANKVIAEILNNEAWKYVSKVGNPKLMNNVMSEISLVIPNDFREISTLSTFFQDLDKAIAKQEEKVNQLKESKQTLLRKMFI